MIEISSLSREYIRVPVSAMEAGAAVDPTTDTAQIAFTATTADPTSPDWKSAVWETNALTTPPTYYARVDVGPGGTVTLAKGTYAVWVKVTDFPEIPVRRVGVLVVA